MKHDDRRCSIIDRPLADDSHRSVPGVDIEDFFEDFNVAWGHAVNVGHDSVNPLDACSIRVYASPVVATNVQARPGLSQLQGSLLVLATAVVFSFGGLAFREASTTASAWEYVTFRGLGSLSVALIVLTAQNRGRPDLVLRRAQPTHLVAGLLLGLISCIFVVALELASVAFVLFLQTLAPITAAYFTWVIMSERPSSKVMIATAVSILGVVVMVGGTLTEDVSTGGLIALIIPFTFGLYATLIRSADKIDPTVPIVVSGSTMLIGGFVVSMLLGGISISAADAAVGFLAGSVLLGIPLVFFNTAQRVVPSAETSLLLLVEVVLAPVWVWLFISERPATTTLIGGSIILGAVVWLTVVRIPRRGRTFTSRG